MSYGNDLIRTARAQGYQFRIDESGTVKVKPLPPPETLAVLREHKAEILDALRGGAGQGEPLAPATPPEARKAVLTRRAVVQAAVKKAVSDPLEQSRLLRFAESEARSYCQMFELREQADREWFFCNEIEDYLRERLGQIIRWQMESDQITGWELVPIRATASATAPKATGKQARQGRLI